MAACGINVPADASVSPADLRRLGASWIRIVATPGQDLRLYLTDLRQAGIRTLPVLARESGGNYAYYRRMYGELVDAIEVGNEPDLDSPSSWTMSPAELSALGRSVRAAFPDTHLVLGGLASGQPSWLRDVDLSPFDSIGVHPYGKSPDREWPHPGWGTGYLGDLLDGYAAYGLPLVVSELGLSTDEVSEDFQAEYLARFGAYFNTRDDVPLWLWFCALDSMV